MNTVAVGKGDVTRDRILDHASQIARRQGLEGLTIGALAESVGMSKSGVFAHFGSREELQLAVLDRAASEFTDQVLRPAFLQPRGLARLRAIERLWLERARMLWESGGCLLIAAMGEFDDRPGAIRDRLQDQHRGLRAEIVRCLQMAIDTGELRADTDPAQTAFEIYGTVLVLHHDLRIFEAEQAIPRAHRAFAALIERCLS